MTNRYTDLDCTKAYTVDGYKPFDPDDCSADALHLAQIRFDLKVDRIEETISPVRLDLDWDSEEDLDVELPCTHGLLQDLRQSYDLGSDFGSDLD